MSLVHKDEKVSESEAKKQFVIIVLVIIVLATLGRENYNLYLSKYVKNIISTC